MRTIFGGLLMSLAFSSPCLSDDAKAVFDSLYSAKIKQVTGTGDRADDLALARNMLDSAKSSTATPGLLTLLCEASYDLSHRQTDGFATAAAAMTLLAEQVEMQRGAAREKLVEVLMKQSRTGKAEERDAANEKLIDLLLVIGDEKVEARKWTEAAADFRRAIAVAAPRKSPRLEETKARLDDAMRLDLATRQVARLQEKLLENANDTATAEEIVRLYVIELEDPASAMPLLARVQSESLKRVVPLVGKAAGDLNAEESLVLGEWYRAEAAAASPPNRELWVKAEQYLARFLEVNTETGLTSTKASVLHKEVKGKLEALKPVAKAERPARLPRNPLIATDKHFGFTGFQKENNVYTLASAAPIPAARTRLRYKAHTDGGAHSFGEIHVRLDDRDWVKVGEWSDVTLVESGKNEHWTEIELKSLPANVNARKMEVRFQFTKGGWRMQMYEVQWVTK